MMKRIVYGLYTRKGTLLYTLALSFLLVSCTLYMDEDGIPRREGDGYSTTEKIETEDFNITYKYAKNTIGIDENVESFVTKVENDSIVYFSVNTPEEFLPREGEMLVCGETEMFPDGFGHKVLKREKQGNEYRCVCSSLDDIFEAFDELEYEGVFHPYENMVVSGSGQQAAYDFFQGLENEAGSSPLKQYEQTPFESRAGGEWEDEDTKYGAEDLISISLINGKKELEFPGVTASVDGNLDVYAGIVFRVYGSKTQQIKRNTLSLIVGAGGKATYEIGLGEKIPISIPVPAKIGASLVVIKALLGFDLAFFVQPQMKFKGEMGFDCGISTNFIWEKTANHGWRFSECRPDRYSRSGSNESAFFCNLLSPDLHQDIMAGFDISFGGEIDCGVTGKFGVTASAYAELDVDVTGKESDFDSKSTIVDGSKVLSVDYVDSERHPIDFKVDFSKSTSSGAFTVDTKSLANVHLGALNVHLFPSLQNLNIITTGYNEETEVQSLESMIEYGRGVASWVLFWDFTPWLYIYESENSTTPIITMKLNTGKANGKLDYKAMNEEFSSNYFPEKKMKEGESYWAETRLHMTSKTPGEPSWWLLYRRKPFRSSKPLCTVAKTGGGQGVKLLQTQKGSFPAGVYPYDVNTKFYNYKYKVRLDLSMANLSHESVLDFGVVCGTYTPGDYWHPHIDQVICSFRKDLSPYVKNIDRSEKSTLVFSYFTNNQSKEYQGEVFSTYIKLATGKTIYYWNNHRYVATSNKNYNLGEGLVFIQEGSMDIRLRYVPDLETEQSFPEWGTIYDLEKLRNSGSVGTGGSYVH